MTVCLNDDFVAREYFITFSQVYQAHTCRFLRYIFDLMLLDTITRLLSYSTLISKGE